MGFWIVCDLPILCLTIVIYLLARIIISRDDEQQMIVLKWVLIFAAAFIFTDAVLSLLDLGIIQMPYPGIYATNIAYNLIGILLSLSFFAYSRIVLGIETGKGKRRKKILMSKINIMVLLFEVYAVVLILLCIFSYKTDWFMIRDANGPGTFDYGTLDILWYMDEYLPLLVSLILSIQHIFNKKYYGNREKYMPIMVFCILIAIIAVVQYCVSDSYPIISIGVTVAMVYLFINTAERKVSQDELTQTDNRRQMFRDMSAMAEKGHRVTWYMLMMDGDDFKMINDSYGHSEGDRALIKIADILKVSCRKQNAKLYRYGGDEFVILKETEGSNIEDCNRQVREFCIKIKNRFNEYNNVSGKSYKLSVSIGWSRFGEVEDDSLKQLLNRADNRLYEAKVYDRR